MFTYLDSISVYINMYVHSVNKYIHTYVSMCALCCRHVGVVGAICWNFYQLQKSSMRERAERAGVREAVELHIPAIFRNDRE